MREDLAMMRRTLDPQRQHPALDQMVLVGHSMGGLVSKMQTVDSGDEFWHTTSDHPFAELKADPDDAQRTLANAYFFDPSPSVRRVVTIGTPHRGSEFANSATRWLGHKLITLPAADARRAARVAGAATAASSAQTRRSRSPPASTRSRPIRRSCRRCSTHRPVRGSSITTSSAGSRTWVGGAGSPMRATASCRWPAHELDNMRQLASQIIVPADHVSIHRHPQSILEVRRVLLEQLAELENFPAGR